MPNNQAHDPRVTLAQNRIAQAVGLSVAAIPAGGGSMASGFVAETGFTLTDNGDGTLTITDAQSRFGAKPNGAKAVRIVDFSTGSDQPTADSRTTSPITWASQCGITTVGAKPGSTHAMVVDTSDPTATNTAAWLYDIPENAGRRYFRHIVYRNEFTWTELLNAQPSGPNLKHGRWEDTDAQTANLGPYQVNVIQGTTHRYSFKNDGINAYDSQMYDPTVQWAAKSWMFEEEYHEISSDTAVADASMYGVFNGELVFSRLNADSTNGYAMPAGKWDKYKIESWSSWAATGVCPFLYDFILLDDSWCRIYITDKPTWSDAETKALEIQIPLGWAAGQIDFRQRIGILGTLSGKYLWVVDSDNNKILIGGRP